MAKTDFIEYQREYEAVGIGDLLYDLVLSVGTKVIPHYPPNLYPPYYRHWDGNAIQEATHDFIVSWLLEPRRLEYYLYSLDSSLALEKSLQNELQRFMANNRRRTEFTNLFVRTKRMLKASSRFKSFGAISRNNEIWGFIEWEDEPIVRSQDEVLETLWKISLPSVIKYRLDSKKISHLISDQTLSEMLNLTFEKLSKKIDMYTLMSSIRYRLGLMEITEKSLHDLVSSTDVDISYEDVLPTSSATLEDHIVAQEVAENVYHMLTDRQRRVLGQYLISSSTLQDVAVAMHLSKSTIHNELKIIEKLVSTSVNEAESENVFARLTELCLDDIEDQNLTSNTTTYEEDQNHA